MSWTEKNTSELEAVLKGILYVDINNIHIYIYYTYTYVYTYIYIHIYIYYICMYYVLFRYTFSEGAWKSRASPGMFGGDCPVPAVAQRPSWGKRFTTTRGRQSKAFGSGLAKGFWPLRRSAQVVTRDNLPPVFFVGWVNMELKSI